MPVQVNEVIIKAVVDPRPSTGEKEGLQCSQGSAGGPDSEIVEKLLEVIREKKER
jgi:hypothetical protein